MPKKSIIVKGVGVCILLIFYAILYKLLIHRLTAFGCMDDCPNFMAGYFLLSGKQLFTQIFYNHAPFIAHMSAFIQAATHPQNLYELILRHRQFLLLFGLLSSIVLFIRFGLAVIPFIFLYELTKFYLGGDRFLAESFIVYPMSFLLGLVFLTLQKKSLYFFDFLLAAVATWFVVFMREPYIPVVLILYAGIVVFNLFSSERTKHNFFLNNKAVVISFVLLLVLCTWTFFSYNPREYIFNVFVVNVSHVQEENAQTGVLGVNAYQTIFYPFVIFISGEWNFVRYVEMDLSTIFLVLSFYFLLKKQFVWIGILWIVLAFANLRLITPGQEYYAAFHLLTWYSLTIFATSLMLEKVWQWNKKVFTIGAVGIVGILCFVLFSKGSYIYDNINEQTEFITNYGLVLQLGNVVNALSIPKDTLFLDGTDDMIYWVSKRYSPYKYSWYTSLMPGVKKYTDARSEMFVTNQPDFYYKACSPKTNLSSLPSIIQIDYVRLNNLNAPSCLWVKKSKLASITLAQKNKAKESLYTIPE